LGRATEWGDNVRSSFDLHRLQIYEKLGVRAPTSFSDERSLAVRVNQALLYGHPLLTDDLWRVQKLNGDNAGCAGKSGYAVEEQERDDPRQREENSYSD